MMTLEEYYKHAYSLYQKGVDAEGEERKRHLRDAMNVLANLPDEWPGKKDLEDKIRYML